MIREWTAISSSEKAIKTTRDARKLYNVQSLLKQDMFRLLPSRHDMLTYHEMEGCRWYSLV